MYVDGEMRHKAFAFLQRLADKLSCSWESNILSWIRVCLTFAIIWVTGLCFSDHMYAGVVVLVRINDGTGLHDDLIYSLLIFGWFTDYDQLFS